MIKIQHLGSYHLGLGEGNVSMDRYQSEKERKWLITQRAENRPPSLTVLYTPVMFQVDWRTIEFVEEKEREKKKKRRKE